METGSWQCMRYEASWITLVARLYSSTTLASFLFGLKVKSKVVLAGMKVFVLRRRSIVSVRLTPS